jgi:hypothetical protein
MAKDVPTAKPRRRALRLGLVLAAVAVEALVLVRHGYPPYGGRVRVRCREGHEFTMIWLPGISLRSLRLGPKRLMRCKPGKHWSLVTLVDRSAPEEKLP